MISDKLIVVTNERACLFVVNGLPSPPLPAPPPGEVCSVSCQTEQPRDVVSQILNQLINPQED